MDTSKLRFGIPHSPFFENLHPEVAEAVNTAIDVLRSKFPHRRNNSSCDIPTTANLTGPGAYAYHAKYLPESAGLYHEIAMTDSWQFRYPVGPDAMPLISWRKGMTDEQWVDLHSADDETFQRLMSARQA